VRGDFSKSQLFVKRMQCSSGHVAEAAAHPIVQEGRVIGYVTWFRFASAAIRSVEHLPVLNQVLANATPIPRSYHPSDPCAPVVKPPLGTAPPTDLTFG
jgi:hypothetical protein